MVLPDNPETDSNHYNDDSLNYPNQIIDNPQFIDNDNANILNSGYQPLGSNNALNDLSDDEYSSDSEIEDEPNSPVDLPTLPTVDSCIQLELWNNPRPSDVNIELDNKRTQEILSAMASISLPTSAVPQWAQNVPEDKWKDVLMEKIRQKK